jgi:hypothetical protein
MRVIILSVLMMLVCGVGHTQCVGENTNVEIDEILGSVKVTTQYRINGKNVDIYGKPCDNCPATSGRYDESQGTIEEILTLNESDRKHHCENLIYRSLTTEQQKQISESMLAETKKKNELLKNEMLKSVGTSTVTNEFTKTYKDLEIKIDANQNITTIDKSFSVISK